MAPVDRPTVGSAVAAAKHLDVPTFAYGYVLVASSHKLPQLPLSTESRTPDLRLLLEEPTDQVEPASEPACTVYHDAEKTVAQWTVWRTEEGFLLRVHGYADFELRGDDLIWSPATNVDVAVASQLLVDLALPRFLHLRGVPCLHAGGVSWPDGVVAFVAPTGSGKSTLCAHLTEGDARLVCDDALMLEARGGAVLAWPSYPSVRVWPDSASAVFGRSDFPLATPRLEKRRVERPCSNRPAPLRHIFLLRPDATLPRAERLGSLEAMAGLVEAVPRLIADDVSSKASEFSLLSDVVARVPISRLQIPHDYDQLPAVARCVRAAL